MTTSQKIEQAALNNALWCDAVCTSHGCPGKFHDAAWVNLRRTPPFYPNAVTLGGTRSASLHRATVQEMIRSGPPTGWAIKDSFQTLSPDPMAFQSLFEAKWIYNRATTSPRKTDISGIRWELVTTGDVLEEWEKAWGDTDVGRVFLPQLLLNKDVAIFAAWRKSRIVAGFIANRSAECVGISNVFVPVDQSQEFRRECLLNAQAAFPDLPLVGYESGSALTDMQSCGFEAIGSLTVWLHIGNSDSDAETTRIQAGPVAVGR